jgi:hypothetical protein
MTLPAESLGPIAYRPHHLIKPVDLEELERLLKEGRKVT